MENLNNGMDLMTTPEKAFEKGEEARKKAFIKDRASIHQNSLGITFVRNAPLRKLCYKH